MNREVYVSRLNVPGLRIRLSDRADDTITDDVVKTEAHQIYTA